MDSVANLPSQMISNDRRWEKKILFPPGSDVIVQTTEQLNLLKLLLKEVAQKEIFEA